MKKSKIVELITSYHGEVNCEPLIVQEPYRKGWVKRLLDTRTDGILKLETFLQSEAIGQLALDDEIEGDNLLGLLEIMYERDKRIYKTSRSYENYPEKNTNRVYNRLYHLLLLDASIQAEIRIPFTHTEALHQVLFSRITNQVLADLEERAKKASEQEDYPQNAKPAYLQLGLALIFGGQYIKHTFDKQENTLLEQVNTRKKEIKFNDQFIRVEFIFLNGQLHAAQFIDTEIQCQQDIRAGLKWLQLGSDNGDKEASIRLASYYARRKDYGLVNLKADPVKTIEFLTIASSQGSQLAERVLDEGLTFGMVSVYNEDNSYSLSPLRS